MLWLPKWLRDDDAPPEEPSRRSFIFLGAAAGLALAMPAPVQIFDLSDVPEWEFPPAGGFNLAEANRILKELYLPNVTKQLENQTLLLKYMEKEDPECSYCGRPIVKQMTDCPGCGALLRRKDFSVPEELAKDMKLMRDLARGQG